MRPYKNRQKVDFCGFPITLVFSIFPIPGGIVVIILATTRMPSFNVADVKSRADQIVLTDKGNIEGKCMILKKSWTVMVIHVPN